MQQQLLSPFTMLMADDCVEAEHDKAGEHVSASRTIQCKAKDNDGPALKQIRIKPDGAVTLKPGWDIFGMMEMRKTKQVIANGWFRDML